jgi:hypothetical protein
VQQEELGQQSQDLKYDLKNDYLECGPFQHIRTCDESNRKHILDKECDTLGHDFLGQKLLDLAPALFQRRSEYRYDSSFCL